MNYYKMLKSVQTEIDRATHRSSMTGQTISITSLIIELRREYGATRKIVMQILDDLERRNIIKISEDSFISVDNAKDKKNYSKSASRVAKANKKGSKG